MPIDRGSLLREQVREEIMDLLIAGRLPLGERLNEVQLANELGVSRTPLREALSALARDGVVQSQPGKGFFLTNVTQQELRDGYPIIACLERFALRQCDIDSLMENMDDLRRLAQEMAASTDSAQSRRLDDEWHSKLLSSCSNHQVLTLIDSVKRPLNRFEHAYLSDPEGLATSERQHLAILDALAARDLLRAEQELENNWTTGMYRLLERISGSEPNNSDN
ncbi:GntR family transcriptional regulator [Actinoallomurus iriomotensis]|uniref:GntR family transcriptional regulator n=1 Tax=Actinoallomurus iriomotensis TaxID=478107 RepID=A0A9W6VX04_9ACTN|nr:GntR family transcriptional regulator [Actinoallomurus iriomotensis]GLY82132.1 GntR family transcriptional regulator [Actinoallomurus iriomotensis]